MDADRLIGAKIGNCEILQRLGEGTVSTTYLARDDRGKQLVAKQLFQPLAAIPDVTQRFLAATDMSSKIRMKKHLAVVTSQRQSAEGTFLFREYVDGRTLPQVLAEGACDVRKLASGLCDAVRSLASRGVVHGGIHPGNVLVQTDGQVRLADYGVSLSQLTSKIGETYPLEALRYLAPEQLRGETPDARTDIYSLGLILSLLLHGTPKFAGGDRRKLTAQILQGAPETHPVLAPAVHRDPAKRYSSIDQLLDRLDQVFPPPPPPEVKPPEIKEPRLATVTDRSTRRNLLDSTVGPLEIDLTGGQPVRVAIEIANGPDTAIELTIAGDQTWLQPEPQRLTLTAGGRGECAVSVSTTGAGESGRLTLTWRTSKSTRSEAVAFRRKQPAAPVPTPTPVKPPDPMPPPHPVAVGKLSKAVDVKGGQDLIALPATELWRVARTGQVEQRPLQLVNGGNAPLRLEVKCQGKGMSASPASVDIQPGRIASLMVSFTPDSDQFSGLEFRWTSHDALQTKLIKVYRPA